MRIGLGLPHLGSLASPDAIRTVALAAEAAGLDSLWAMDRLLSPMMRSGAAGYGKGWWRGWSAVFRNVTSCGAVDERAIGPSEPPRLRWRAPAVRQLMADGRAACMADGFGVQVSMANTLAVPLSARRTS